MRIDSLAALKWLDSPALGAKKMALTGNQHVYCIENCGHADITI
jgi:hypothetical protein